MANWRGDQGASSTWGGAATIFVGVAAVITGITNATSESLNRLAKLEARQAYGFRNPLNQRRRVRIACTRGYRRRSRTATRTWTRKVTGRKPDPG